MNEDEKEMPSNTSDTVDTPLTTESICALLEDGRILQRQMERELEPLYDLDQALKLVLK